MINTKIGTQTLRKLDDVACTSVVTVRNIRKLLKKYPSLADIATDCWVHGGHYIKFTSTNNKFTWYASETDSFVKRTLTGEEEDLDREQLNKLLVHTYRTMIENLDPDIEIMDTPEDILAYAEQKLQDILSEESANTDD